MHVLPPNNHPIFPWPPPTIQWFLWFNPSWCLRLWNSFARRTSSVIVIGLGYVFWVIIVFTVILWFSHLWYSSCTLCLLAVPFQLGACSQTISTSWHWPNKNQVQLFYPQFRLRRSSVFVIYFWPVLLTNWPLWSFADTWHPLPEYVVQWMSPNQL